LLEPIANQILIVIGNCLLALNPQRAPGFLLSWLELISHRLLMPKLLLSKAQKQTWPLYNRLLIELFKFLEPFVRSAEMNETLRMVYKGTLRILLVLLHDFPEFLCEFHFSFCDVIPTTCVQMRNIILSAFPRAMRLPDPFTPNLKVDLLPEISQSPRMMSNYLQSMQASGLLKDLESFMLSRSPISFLMELPKRLLYGSSEEVQMNGGIRYNVPLINSMVLAIGICSISIQQKAQPGSTQLLTATSIEIFQRLAIDLDSEGRYYLFNAIANQLRYPNSHTYYFSCVLLHLFAEVKVPNQTAIQEQVTRVLLERLIVNRPHPWGLLITFIELIKNPRYNFWNFGFTRCAPEIERVFESVARSCIKTEDPRQ